MFVKRYWRTEQLKNVNVKKNIFFYLTNSKLGVFKDIASCTYLQCQSLMRYYQQ